MVLSYKLFLKYLAGKNRHNFSQNFFPGFRCRFLSDSKNSLHTCRVTKVYFKFSRKAVRVLSAFETYRIWKFRHRNLLCLYLSHLKISLKVSREF